MTDPIPRDDAGFVDMTSIDDVDGPSPEQVEHAIDALRKVTDPGVSPERWSSILQHALDPSTPDLAGALMELESDDATGSAPAPGSGPFPTIGSPDHVGPFHDDRVDDDRFHDAMGTELPTTDESLGVEPASLSSGSGAGSLDAADDAESTSAGPDRGLAGASDQEFDAGHSPHGHDFQDLHLHDVDFHDVDFDDVDLDLGDDP